MGEKQVFQAFKAILHIFYAYFIVVPYYYLEALVTLLRPKEKPKSVKGEVVLLIPPLSLFVIGADVEMENLNMVGKEFPKNYFFALPPNDLTKSKIIDSMRMISFPIKIQNLCSGLFNNNSITKITGTGHGIGKLLAIKYAQEGAIVVAWDINEELNAQTVQHIQELGYKNIYGYKVDVSNRQNVMEIAEEVRNSVGDVTILINNAGIMPHHLFLEHTETEVRRIIDVNVMGNFWTLQAFLPAMQKNNYGHVVALCSLAGLVGIKNLVPYNASKFAIRGLMDGLYEEFRRSPNNNIYFTTIYPYMVDTGLCKRVEITYPIFYKMLKPEYVVEKLFEAQVNNKHHVNIPKSIGHYIILKTVFYPEKAGNYFTDNLKTDLLSDIAFESNGQSNDNRDKPE